MFAVGFAAVNACADAMAAHERRWVTRNTPSLASF